MPLDPQKVYQIRESDSEYLCQSFLQMLSLGMSLVGWGWGVILIAMGESSAAWLAPIALIVAGYLSNHWHESRRILASAIALMALWLAPAIAAQTLATTNFLFGLTLAILLAGILAGRMAIALLTLSSAGLILAAEHWLAYPLDPATSMTLLIAIGMVTGVSWLLSLHVGGALELSWQSRQQAIEAMRSAQARRAELRRAVKSLDEGYERLQHLNRELMAARREAEEARHLKAEFAANVSHELRTPINLIVGFSEMMYTAPESYGGQPLPPEYRGDVHAVYRSARHLQTLIDDILDLSRIDARQMALTREMVCIEEVIAEAAQVIGDLVERKGLDLHIELPPRSRQLPILYLDRTRIRQVLLNLISNAVRFTEQGAITVSCRLCNAAMGEVLGEQHTPFVAEGQFLCVSVADSGIGIRPEDMDKVFQAFRQVDGSARRRYGGTGLGLAISKRFVELHGGWMWAESEPGQGSTFSFALPAAEEIWLRQGLIATASQPGAATTGKRVIVLDRDPGVVQLFSRYLRHRRVQGVSTVEEALESAANLAPELLVLADGTPPEALLARQHEYPRLSKAHLSILSCPIPSERRKALSLGFVDYLLKPVMEGQLQASLERVVEAPDHVLVVEDDPDMMRLLGRMLARIRPGVTVARAYSGKDAQHILADGPRPDVILLDLTLPEISGYDLMTWMQERELLTCPVIAITANVRLEAPHAPDTTAMTIARQAGFSAQEVLTFAELVAEHMPCRYIGESASDKDDPSLSARRQGVRMG
jgi:signal transduction histidine kinase/DNA-binding response OmpR family regulator